MPGWKYFLSKRRWLYCWKMFYLWWTPALYNHQKWKNDFTLCIFTQTNVRSAWSSFLAPITYWFTPLKNSNFLTLVCVQTHDLYFKVQCIFLIRYRDKKHNLVFKELLIPLHYGMVSISCLNPGWLQLVAIYLLWVTYRECKPLAN